MTVSRRHRLPPGVSVREATPDDLPAVLGVLDGAALETDADRVRASVGTGDVLVAVSDGADGTGETVVGALVLDGEAVTSVAVRRRRRGQGIGTALVRAAAGRRDRLVAEFRGEARPFYETLGFEVEALAGPGRFRGTLVPGSADGRE